MPIELRELIISAEVTDHNTAKPTNALSAINIKQKEHLVEECVERVFEILKRQNER